ncbi:unnamed protein product [Phytophthora lilii]|uniref:Unnamed protein product n=1 Tax=Phytophthora lilii TaxID=2077276 RepID=A0A9W6XIC9_9STRA|nr:unnamed protein product [Phytophthora lilii]
MTSHTLPISGGGPRCSPDGFQPTEVLTEASVAQSSELGPLEEKFQTTKSKTVETLYNNYVCALVSGEPDKVDIGTTETAEHTTTVGVINDYAHELVFLPGLSDSSVTDLDYTGGHVISRDLSQDDQHRLLDVLKAHETILISGGNALPPPAYGVVCNIDV